MAEWKVFFGLAAIVASIVTTWMVLPRNGKEHPLTERSWFIAFIIPLIIAAAVLGIAFVVSGLA